MTVATFHRSFFVSAGPLVAEIWVFSKLRVVLSVKRYYLSVLCCSHYFVNGGFFKSNEHLLDNIDKIRRIPTTIVQGRYDVVCPMKTASELHKVSLYLVTR